MYIYIYIYTCIVQAGVVHAAAFDTNEMRNAAHGSFPIGLIANLARF